MLTLHFVKYLIIRQLGNKNPELCKPYVNPV